MSQMREEFVYAMARYSGASIGQCRDLMRMGATHVRIETELTNGYKKHTASCKDSRRDFTCCNGEYDAVATQKAVAKRTRYDERMEALAKSLGVRIEYGALTVRVVFADGREAGIP